MKMFFKEASIKTIVVGLLKKSIFLGRLFPKRAGGTYNSRYCYSVWLRHLVKLNSLENQFLPKSVAELGPGDTIGTGIAALLSGAEEYTALDVQKYWNPAINVRMLDELIILFNNREPIPDDLEFPRVSPKLNDYSFPSSILTNELLRKSLSSERIVDLKNELKQINQSGNKMVHSYAPWYNPSIIRKNSIDLILSQSVLQHIDDLKNTYAAMSDWLKSNGVMSHIIDFRSLGFTKSWNGHWTLSDFEWKLVRGGRAYAINREPFSTHLKYLDQFGFSIISKELKILQSEIKLDQLSKSYSSLTQEDITVRGMYVIAKKTDNKNLT